MRLWLCTCHIEWCQKDVSCVLSSIEIWWLVFLFHWTMYYVRCIAIIKHWSLWLISLCTRLIFLILICNTFYLIVLIWKWLEHDDYHQYAHRHIHLHGGYSKSIEDIWQSDHAFIVDRPITIGDFHYSICLIDTKFFKNWERKPTYRLIERTNDVFSSTTTILNVIKNWVFFFEMTKRSIFYADRS